MHADIPTINHINIIKIKDILKKNGELLIKKNGVTLDEFENLSNALMIPMIHHATNTIERDPINEDGSTSTVNKGMDAIPFHREGSYAPGCPDILMFYCITPAKHDGKTLLCDGVKLLETLPQRIKNFVNDVSIIWRWTVPPERWKTTLGVKTVEEAVQRLEVLKKRFFPWESLDEIRFEGDILHGAYKTLASIPTRWGGNKSFCNSLLIHHFRETSDYYAKPLFTPFLEDGQPFPGEILKEIVPYAKSITQSINWDPYDILIIDNSRVMHGRQAFTDKNRKILIRMGYANEQV